MAAPSLESQSSSHTNVNFDLVLPFDVTQSAWKLQRPSSSAEFSNRPLSKDMLKEEKSVAPPRKYACIGRVAWYMVLTELPLSDEKGATVVGYGSSSSLSASFRQKSRASGLEHARVCGVVQLSTRPR